MRRVLAAALLLVAGCATVPRPPALTAAQAEAAQQAREARWLAHPDWRLQGRIAVSDGRDGGSGRIDWTQRGGAYEVELSAPVTRQSWRLVGDAARARIEGLAGGPREAGDPQALLREATGWELPIAALAHWVRGARAPGAPARIEYGPGGLPARIRQGGWTIDYAWPAPAACTGFPRRIDARRDGARVRLVIDQASVVSDWPS